MDFSFPLLNHFQCSNNRMKLHWSSLNVRISNETQTYDLYKRRIWRLLLFDLENRGTLSRFFVRPFRGHWFTQTRSLCSAILSTRGNFNENQRITYCAFRIVIDVVKKPEPNIYVSFTILIESIFFHAFEQLNSVKRYFYTV